jgi:hypothetical protein
MRGGNVLYLSWSQVNLQKRVINLDMTKTGKRLTLPIADTSLKVLVAMKSAGLLQGGDD